MNDLQLPLFDAIEIPLTKGYKTLIDPIDSDLAAVLWKAEPNRDNGVYATRNTRLHKKHTHHVLHRIVLSRMLGRSLSAGEFVDHIDGDTLNNRRSNLRIATPVQNSCNSTIQKNNKSGYKGVCWDKQRNKWCAQLNVGKQHFDLGRFIDPINAARAYDAAALKYHGEFARTNAMLGLLPPLESEA